MNTLFSHPSFEQTAINVAAKKWWQHGHIRFGSFEGDWPDLFIEEVHEKVQGKNIYYLANIANSKDLFPNIAVIQSLPRYFSEKLEVIIPFFPVGTMERVQQEGEIATAKTLMRILSATPPARSGQTLFYIFDIHDIHERFYGSDNVLIKLETLIPLLKKRLEDTKNLAIAFPDEWAFKRFKWDFRGYDIIICSKIREGDTRKITVQEGDPKGKNIVIVDDLIRTGGTIVEAAKALRNLWAASVSAYASHGVFPSESHIKVASALDTLYVTDSIPENIKRAKSVMNMEVLSIESRILEMLGG